MPRRNKPVSAPRFIASSPAAVQQAAKTLARGGIVLFPTETVYGLAVRFGDPRALARLRRLKGRGATKPFQILISSRKKASELCGPLIGPAAKLARAFWPGPLTLVLPFGKSTMGLRLPGHAMARRFTRLAGGAIIATSANRSGLPPAGNVQDALAQLGNKVDFILDGGPAGSGSPSTVVQCTGNCVTILRTGAIAPEEIDEVLKPRSTDK